MLKLPRFHPDRNTAVLVIATLILSAAIGLTLIWLNRPPEEVVSFNACTTPTGIPLHHSQITFGTCGTDICPGKLGRPVYQCQDGAVLSVCIPDETCRDQSTSDNPYGHISVPAGRSCPEEALFGCTCSSGPGLDDRLVIDPSTSCPYRFCFSLNHLTRQCFKETYYYADICPTNLLLFDSDSDCQSFNSSLSDADLQTLIEAAKFGQYSNPPQSSNSSASPEQGSNPGLESPSAQNLSAGIGPGSTLSQLYARIVGKIPTQYLSSQIAEVLDPNRTEPLELGVDPDNPNYITITSPQSNASLQGIVPITGGAIHENFTYYSLEYAPDPNPRGTWTPLTDTISTPVFDGVLYTWDTTKIPNGIYQLRLVVSLQKTHFHYRYITLSKLQVHN